MMAGPRTGGGRPGRFRRLPRRAWIAISGTAAAASLGLALLVFTAVFISVAIPRANLGQRTRALQRVLAAAPATSTAVLGDLSYTTFDVNFNEHPFAADQLAATRAELAGPGRPRTAAGDGTGLGRSGLRLCRGHWRCAAGDSRAPAADGDPLP